MFLRVDCHLSYSFANDVFFLKLEVFWLNIFNTNSIQLAPSDDFAWYESFVLPEIEFKSEVLNHQLFTQLSLLVLFNFVATKNILPLSKPRENMENLRGDLYLCQNAGRGVQFSGDSLRNRFEDRAYGACKEICPYNSVRQIKAISERDMWQSLLHWVQNLKLHVPFFHLMHVTWSQIILEGSKVRYCRCTELIEVSWRGKVE